MSREDDTDSESKSVHVEMQVKQEQNDLGSPPPPPPLPPLLPPLNPIKHGVNVPPMESQIRSHPLTNVNATLNTPGKVDAAFSICWSNLSYQVPSSKKDGYGKLLYILSNLNGSISAGQLTGIIGPSGSGKTCLIECIAGIRRKGREGNISFNSDEQMKLSFIPQNDYYIDLLTVKEALTFANRFTSLQSQLVEKKNKVRKNKINPQATNKIVSVTDESERKIDVASIIKLVGLERCKNNYISKCSNGQLKRLSIAQELLVQPNVLLLGMYRVSLSLSLSHFVFTFHIFHFSDEPTSGLDSQTATQTIELLRKLATGTLNGDDKVAKRMSVMITIHQPSNKLFSMFDNIYTLTSTGKCIYNNSPNDELVQFLDKFHLHLPPYTNRAEYLIDVASGNHGYEVLSEMSIESNKVTPIDSSHHKSESVDKMIVKNNSRTMSSNDIYLHFRRSIYIILRNIQLSIVQLISHILIGLLMGYLYSNETIGTADGCNISLDSIDHIDSVFDKINDTKNAISANVGLIFFSIIFVLFGGMMPTVLTYPLEVMAISKERHNGWYGITSYYIGRCCADIPLQIINPVVYVTIIYILTNQLWQVHRFILFIVPFLLISLIAQSHGILVSVIFYRSLQMALFVAPISTIPLVIFCGLFIDQSLVPHYLQFGVYVSYLKYAVDMALIAIYGYDRCDTQAIEEMILNTKRVNKYLSRVISNGLAVDEITNDTFTGEDVDTMAQSSAVQNVTVQLVDSITKLFIPQTFDHKNQSTVGPLAQFKLTDSDWSYNCVLLVIVFLCMRILTLFIIRRNAALTRQ